eukprot:14662753-Alexandrium_andersonii.AAC.1
MERWSAVFELGLCEAAGIPRGKRAQHQGRGEPRITIRPPAWAVPTESSELGEQVFGGDMPMQ